MAERVGREAFIRQQTAIIGRADSRPYLDQIKCPVLAIGGNHDQLTPPEMQQEVVRGVHDGELHIIEECGHLSPIEQPAKLNTLIADFINH